MDAATLAMCGLIDVLPPTQHARLDVSIVWVSNPSMPVYGKWNCRIQMIRDYGSVKGPITATVVETERNTIEEAVTAAVDRFKKEALPS